MCDAIDKIVIEILPKIVLKPDIDPLVEMGIDFNKDSYDDMKRKFRVYIKNKAINLANGNKSKAAEILGVNRKVVYSDFD